MIYFGVKFVGGGFCDQNWPSENPNSIHAKIRSKRVLNSHLRGIGMLLRNQ